MKYLLMLVENFPHQVYPEKARVFNQIFCIRTKFEKSLQIFINTTGNFFLFPFTIKFLFYSLE